MGTCLTLIWVSENCFFLFVLLCQKNTKLQTKKKLYLRCAICYFMAFQAKLHDMSTRYMTNCPNIHVTTCPYSLTEYNIWTQEGECEFSVSDLSFDFLKHSDSESLQEGEWKPVNRGQSVCLIEIIIKKVYSVWTFSSSLTHKHARCMSAHAVRPVLSR